MAVDGSGANIFNGSAWSLEHVLGSGSGGPSGVSCPSASFCVAMALDGSAYTYTVTAWSTKTKVDPGGLDGVTCATTSFCVAFSGGGDRFSTYNGSSWSAPAMVTGGAGPKALACPAATFCMAIDGATNALFWHP